MRASLAALTLLLAGVATVQADPTTGATDAAAATAPVAVEAATAPTAAPAAGNDPATTTTGLRQAVRARRARVDALVAAPPPADDVAARIAWITAVLDAEQKASRWYHWGFFSGFGGVAVIQGSLSVGLDDQTLKDKGLVGASAAAIGFGSMVLAPSPRRTGSAGYAALPRGSDEEMAAVLREAETRLETRANGQRFATSWLSHAGALLVSGSSAATIYVIFDQSALDAALQFVSGFAVGQTKIWITPQGARRAWQAYQATALGLPPPTPVAWHIVPAPGGARLVVTF